MTTHSSDPLLTPETRAILDRLAETTGRSPSEVLADALDAYERQRDEQDWLRGRIENGRRAAREGRVVEHGKVRDWLLGWGTPDEQDPPRCE